MTKDKLFLLFPRFTSETGIKQFCPECMMLQGVLHSFPDLMFRLDVEYVDFAKPRQALVDLVGKDQQSCPALVRNANDKIIAITDLKEILTILRNEYSISSARGLVDG